MTVLLIFRILSNLQVNPCRYFCRFQVKNDPKVIFWGVLVIGVTLMFSVLVIGVTPMVLVISYEAQEKRMDSISLIISTQTRDTPKSKSGQLRYRFDTFENMRVSLFCTLPCLKTRYYQLNFVYYKSHRLLIKLLIKLLLLTLPQVLPLLSDSSFLTHCSYKTPNNCRVMFVMREITTTLTHSRISGHFDLIFLKLSGLVMADYTGLFGRKDALTDFLLHLQTYLTGKNTYPYTCFCRVRVFASKK